VRPSVTADHVVALLPWMVAGAGLHVLYVVGAVTGPVRPLLGTPAVYAAVAVAVGVAWVALASRPRLPVPPVLAALGTLAGLLVVAATLWWGVTAGTLRLAVPAAGFVAAVAVGAAGWLGLRRLSPGVAVTEPVGPLVVFAHALDGVSTAVGVDLLGFGERSPLSRVLIEVAAGLPTASTLGSGWLFVLVKVAVASVILVAFVDYVREDPVEANLLLAFVVGVGLGPGVHNLLLFAVTVPA
jgi:uncharacterized membrane protein